MHQKGVRCSFGVKRYDWLELYRIRWGGRWAASSRAPRCNGIDRARVKVKGRKERKTIMPVEVMEMVVQAGKAKDKK